MSRHDVGMLPVFEGGQMLGVFTDRDITIRVVSEGRDPRKTRVRDIMTPEIIYCYDHEDVNEAVKSFEKMQIRRVPVLNRKKQLVGVLSLGDLAVDSGDKMLVGHVLKKVSEPERLRL
jgi:CBS domain-containing protein